LWQPPAEPPANPPEPRQLPHLRHITQHRTAQPPQELTPYSALRATQHVGCPDVAYVEYPIGRCGGRVAMRTNTWAETCAFWSQIDHQIDHYAGNPQARRSCAAEGDLRKSTVGATQSSVIADQPITIGRGFRREAPDDQPIVGIHGARPLLVLWDVDQTLIEVGGATRRAYATTFTKVAGRVLDQPWQFNGRTELAAVADVLGRHGVDPSPAAVDSFIALLVEELCGREDELRREGRVLAGAEAALRACRAQARVHQSLLTGNVLALASLKMSVFGLAEHVDMRIGAYGGDGIERIDLPAHAWRRAEKHLGHRFTGADTVIVGDTLLDVATGKTVGARVVAVATGPATMEELHAAGAHRVLPDLLDTGAVLDAILG
jgi:phosphoglycolate phosphatase